VLRRRYRDLFRQRLGALSILFLHGPVELIAGRLGARRNRFASISLLESQLQTLEPPGSDENPIALNIEATPETIVAQALEMLKSGQLTAGQPRVAY
jgi:gluconokinase